MRRGGNPRIRSRFERYATKWGERYGLSPHARRTCSTCSRKAATPNTSKRSYASARRPSKRTSTESIARWASTPNSCSSTRSRIGRSRRFIFSDKRLRKRNASRRIRAPHSLSPWHEFRCFTCSEATFSTLWTRMHVRGAYRHAPLHPNRMTMLGMDSIARI